MQVNQLDIYLKPGCGCVHLEMFPGLTETAVRVTINNQLFTPAELRVLARLLEQAADRKEEAFEVVVPT